MKLSETTKKIITWILILISIAAIVTAIVVPIVVITNRKNSIKSYPDIASKNINNETESFVNNNEVSLLFYTQPKINYPTSLIEKVLSKQGDLQDMTDFLFSRPSVASITSGTSWMFDYENNPNSNLVTYYLATNIHVINLSYSVIYNFPNNQKLTLSIPVNTTTSEEVSAYISQPLGSYEKENQKGWNPISNDPNMYNLLWYQLPNFNLSTAPSSLIPLGTSNSAENSNSYLGQIAYENNGQTEQFLIKEDYSLAKVVAATRSTNTSQDFGLVKAEIPNDATFLPKNNQIVEDNESVKKSFENIKTIFNINEMFSGINSNETTDEVKEKLLSSSYISKLNYLNKNINSITRDDFEKIFMFSLIENQPKQSSLTVAGYPGGNTDAYSYTYYNGSTFGMDVVRKSNGYISRPTIQYYENGNLKSTGYDQADNYEAGGVNLEPGSSGSMVVNENGQIVGIYWGIISELNSHSNFGMITPIMTQDTSMNTTTNLLIKYYLYQTKHKNQTELVKLFNAIKARMNLNK